MMCPQLAKVVASNEVLCVHVNLGLRRAAPWPDAVAAMLRRAVADEAHLPPPERSGRAVPLVRADRDRGTFTPR
jgi:acyl-CoA thioester hydrolase